MSEPNPLDDVKTGAQVVGEIIKAAAGSEEAKVAASNLGRSAVTVTAAINNVLLPLAALNFAVERARTYFNTKFADDFQSRAAAIPADRLAEPSALIAAPILNALAFAHEAPILKDLYLNLLARSMDRQHSESVHPAFVETIRQLSPEEAELIKSVLRDFGVGPIVQVEARYANSDRVHVYIRNFLDWRDDSPERVLIENPRMPMLVDNWLRLGLITVDYNRVVSYPSFYNWVETRPEVVKIKEIIARAPDMTLYIRRGVIERTDFGRAFGLAVGICNY